MLHGHGCTVLSRESGTAVNREGLIEGSIVQDTHAGAAAARATGAGQGTCRHRHARRAHGGLVMSAGDE